VKDEEVWIAESLRAAKTSVYVAPIGVGAGPFAVDAKYRRQARAVAAKRVAVAGVRLANLLNAALK
jgi:S1/P1 Nuclease